jgi:rubrerythrin
MFADTYNSEYNSIGTIVKQIGYINQSKGGMRMKESNLAMVIEVAIKREEEAYTFYMDLYKGQMDENVRDTLHYLAKEEQKHKDFLIRYRNEELGPEAMRLNTGVSYHIAEYLEEPDAEDDMAPDKVYLLAAHREQRSFHFYQELAEIHPGGEIKEMLLKMANEELKHKEKMEYLYTNTAFPQTDGG